MKFHIFASVTFLYVSKTKSISSRERLLCGKWSETAEAQQVPGKKEAACPVKWDMPPLSVYREFAWNLSSIPVQSQWVCHLVPKRSACELMSAASSK